MMVTPESEGSIVSTIEGCISEEHYENDPRECRNFVRVAIHSAARVYAS